MYSLSPSVCCCRLPLRSQRCQRLLLLAATMYASQIQAPQPGMAVSWQSLSSYAVHAICDLWRPSCNWLKLGGHLAGHTCLLTCGFFMAHRALAATDLHQTLLLSLNITLVTEFAWQSYCTGQHQPVHQHQVQANDECTN